ncbi:MAG TPA: AAA family ATPase [Hydrogenophaga sp.]|uniref:bifunctional aminoglycoside phosphotransferase/ATP-binding protein n=1 Tax=Hydrogenophaga sp. TaxID=1904254 RepID=UPI002C58CD9D|nr:AAA family ATPase [Hydrogenophaga sp.]HMN93983.1 AAA family ATPase [Hydrogenophaga sp.]HMP09397.1 AAA family ATPase [Hydrogenophaga sp.]
MSVAVPPLIAALLEPTRYPHPVDRVELLQTHGAWVLLAGDRAYKIKKPVALSFMDFSTLDKRRTACEAELRVNSRFAPSDPTSRLYLAALPITGTAQAPVIGGEPAQAIEWAVQMRRFPEADRLDHVAARGELTPAMLQALARHVAGFQATATVADEDGPWGRPEDVAGFARDNLASLRTTLVDDTDLLTVAALSDWTETRLNELTPLLQQRRAEGHVREGHGDLHLANLVRLGGEVMAFDAIEFNDALRWVDVASDIAFTWMDLWHIGQPGLAQVLLSEWLDASGDVSAPAVLPFFAVYRALVRAKVAGIRWTQLGASPDQATLALEEVRTYLWLASRLAGLPPFLPSPALVITHGLSGSGKTWASTRWLAAQADGRAIRLRSDVERKRLHGLAALAASGSGLNTGLYSAQAHGDTYASLRSRAAELLDQGWRVVVDAAFLRQHERQAFADLAKAQGVPFAILACVAPVEVLRERIRARQAGGRDASEATLAVLEQQLGWAEPLTDSERACTLPQ